MNYPEIVKSYLRKYASEKWSIEISGESEFNNSIIIPVICEYENLRTLLVSLSENDPEFFADTLVVVVINNTKAADIKVVQDNSKSISLLRSIIHKKTGDDFIKKISDSGLNIALVDASSDGNEMPEKEGGVGFARKIGMDLALKYFDYQSDNKKILICLDGDCTVEKNYLKEIVNHFNSNNSSAAVIKYEHKIDLSESTAPAIICYEIFLRYYVLGLHIANSPYAFQTVGSAMACDYESYIKIEGMNKRKAAEDFYFLEKLAKVKTVSEVNSTAVYPSSRPSWRVPFGTGQRVNRFLSKVQNEYLLYDPQSFLVLKEWLKLFYSDNNENLILNASKNIHPELYNFLAEQDFQKSFGKILQNTKDEKQLKKQKNFWFDGFKTLKLIHHLRDKTFPPVNMFEAIDRFIELLNIREKPSGYSGDIPPLEIQMEYLNLLRKYDSEKKFKKKLVYAG